MDVRANPLRDYKLRRPAHPRVLTPLFDCNEWDRQRLAIDTRLYANNMVRCEPSHPRENRSAAQISFILAEPSRVTRLPSLFCETVTALCRLTAHNDFIPSSSFSTTDGATRISRPWRAQQTSAGTG